MKAVRLALVGTGSIAGAHAKAIRSIENAQITAVVTTKTDGAESFRGRYDIPHAYPTVEALVKSGTADAAVICTPNALHSSQAITLMRGGLGVLVEKPMAADGESARQMVEASRQTGQVLMVAHVLRFAVEVTWLREKIDAGVLGEIVRSKGYGVHTQWGPEGWFTQKSLAGGGALIDMGIHAIDTVRYLLGDPSPVQVFAKTGNYYSPGDVEDTGSLLVTWENGTSSYIEAGWRQPHSDGDAGMVQVYGTKGYGSVFPTLLKLPNPTTGKTERLDAGFRFPADDAPMFQRQMDVFLSCIQGERQPSPGGLEGWINMKIIDLAYESGRSSSAIDINTSTGWPSER